MQKDLFEDPMRVRAARRISRTLQEVSSAVDKHALYWTSGALLRRVQWYVAGPESLSRRNR